ncbi:dimethyl sulfoxide reductase [Pasteurellaceae bacterium 15-036681]|nr:dimethyl sulfoxide reductase [Pasteurellaceae bacterium 15-036681]
MNAGLNELPLVIFTVLAQSVVGSFLLFTFVLCQLESKNSRLYIHKMMFIPLILLGIGFIASMTHLGSPERAFNSLTRVGESMLSNEIASGAIFFALAGCYWLLAILGKMPENLGKVWLIITSLIGLVFMYMMANVYRISSVPTWDTAVTDWSFYLTVIVAGFVLGYMLLKPNRYSEYSLKWVPWVFVVGVLFVAIIVVYQGNLLATTHSSVQQAVGLVPDFAPMMVVRLSCLAVAGALLFKARTLPLLSVAVLFALVAEFIGRVLFYGSHMTYGMAISG